ncbi:MAG: agmatine deiminase family protein [Fimbriiglobus sp.]
MNPVPQLRMPAEWEPHASTWLAWPHRESDWPGKFEPIRWVYGEIVRSLARFELVNIIVRDEAQETMVRETLDLVHAPWPNIQLHTLPTDRSWLRDSGAIFVKAADGSRLALDWRFNGWAKYEDWTLDDKVPELMANVTECPRQTPMFGEYRIVLEGGSIDVNGQGALLTTEECLLSQVQERNPPMQRSDYEQSFQQYLGVNEVLWLDRGIAGDDTHGHVDDLARFVNPNTIVMVEEHDPSDENFEVLEENWKRAKHWNNYRFVPLPMPRPVVFDGQRLPASYANFYIGNGVVLVPTFNDPADRVALNTLADLFPTRSIIGINATDLIYGLGTLHCLSQQEPAS